MNKKLTQEEIAIAFDELFAELIRETGTLQDLLAKPEDYYWNAEESASNTVKKCDCGAKHTSFPNHHMSWCSLGGKKK